jgi:hypothetical protein
MSSVAAPVLPLKPLVLRDRYLAVSVAGLLALGFAGAARAATGSGFGTSWEADSSSAATVQTRILQLGPEVSEILTGRLRYELGFATVEAPATGFLYDSLTISLAKADGSASTVVVTGDVFGLTIAPLTPGGLLAAGGLAATEITPSLPSLAGFTTVFAYNIDVELPPALRGIPLLTTFDFFHNDDGRLSRGYALVVPEPPTWALLLTGGAFAPFVYRRVGGARR